MRAPTYLLTRATGEGDRDAKRRGGGGARRLARSSKSGPSGDGGGLFRWPAPHRIGLKSPVPTAARAARGRVPRDRPWTGAARIGLFAVFWGRRSRATP